jgi:sodium/bile acid cotransporter 7
METCPRLDRAAIQLCTDHFLVVGFTLAAVVALVYPDPGIHAGSVVIEIPGSRESFQLVELVNNICVFLVSGLSLRTEEVWDVVYGEWQLLIYGLVTINFVTTLVAPVLLNLSAVLFSELALGFAIFATVPTTLGVGVALTLQAKGDSALSVMLTVLSNILGVVSVPYLLTRYLSRRGDVNTSNVSINIDPQHLALRLAYSVLVPTLTGLLLRKYSAAVAAFAMRHRVGLGLFANANLVCMVWMALSASRQELVMLPFSQMLLVIIVAVVLHIVYLVYNYLIAVILLQLPLRQVVSMTIMGSQKSSPVALTVIANMRNTINRGSIIGSAGLLAIPCVIGQLTQILMGSVLASYFRKKSDQAAFENARSLELRSMYDYGAVSRYEET